MILGNPVLCDPQLPEDWAQREARLALEVQAERAAREKSHTNPAVLWIFHRPGLI